MLTIELNIEKGSRYFIFHKRFYNLSPNILIYILITFNRFHSPPNFKFIFIKAIYHSIFIDIRMNKTRGKKLASNSERFKRPQRIEGGVNKFEIHSFQPTH